MQSYLRRPIQISNVQMQLQMQLENSYSIFYVQQTLAYIPKGMCHIRFCSPRIIQTNINSLTRKT